MKNKVQITTLIQAGMAAQIAPLRCPDGALEAVSALLVEQIGPKWVWDLCDRSDSEIRKLGGRLLLQSIRAGSVIIPAQTVHVRTWLDVKSGSIRTREESPTSSRITTTKLLWTPDSEADRG